MLLQSGLEALRPDLVLPPPALHRVEGSVQPPSEL